MLSEMAEDITIKIHGALVYKSAQHQQDPATMRLGAGVVIPIGEEEELEALKLQGDTITAENHTDRIMQSIKDLSFLGDAGFGNLIAGMSGEGFSIALNPLQQIVELKLPQRRDTLSSICAFLLQCFEEKAAKDASFRGYVKTAFEHYALTELTPDDIKGQYRADIVYGNMLPRDDFLFAQNELYKLKAGGQSLRTTLDKIGFDDPDAELERMIEEFNDPVLNPERVLATAQAKQVQAQAKQGPPPVPTTGGGPPPPPTKAPAGLGIPPSADGSQPFMPGQMQSPPGGAGLPTLGGVGGVAGMQMGQAPGGGELPGGPPMPEGIMGGAMPPGLPPGMLGEQSPHGGPGGPGAVPNMGGGPGVPDLESLMRRRKN
jgi:hypothetical protein